MTEERLETIFFQKAKELNAKGALFKVTVDNLALMKKHDIDTFYHQIRVSLVAERIAYLLGKKDVKPEFFGGANHDVGKLKLETSYLHEKHLTQEGYEKIKKHVESGRESLEEFLFVSTIAAAHHSLQKNSYGKSVEEVLKGIKLAPEACERLKEALIAVSIADFYDACNTRETGLMWGGKKKDCAVISEIYPEYSVQIKALETDDFIKEIYGR